MKNSKKKIQETSPLELKCEKQKPSSQIKPDKPVLRFTPFAWAKLHYFCHRGETEIGGFGISDPEELLLVKDFVTVKQEVSMASVSFDDEAVGNFFEDQVDLGRKPEEFGRVWLHSHPGDSPIPSSIDEETFHRVFRRCEWAVMFVMARTGKTYARLCFTNGPGGHFEIPVKVDYSCQFEASDHETWQSEYEANIKKVTTFGSICDVDTYSDLELYSYPEEWEESLGEMDPSERRFLLNELANQPDFGDEESEVIL